MHEVPLDYPELQREMGSLPQFLADLIDLPFYPVHDLTEKTRVDIVISSANAHGIQIWNPCELCHDASFDPYW